MYRNNSRNQVDEQVTVRRSAQADEAALFELAALDSGAAPAGPALVAEAGDRIVAALPLGAGRAIADPFVPTAELVALLELRRAQLLAAEPRLAGRSRLSLRGRLRVAARRAA